eukprot:m.1210292 g.1210292  ORF g.1210292 m.1210292 type:complete len:821 (-) comp24592_c0_seq21:2704-5166(-)
MASPVPAEAAGPNPAMLKVGAIICDGQVAGPPDEGQLTTNPDQMKLGVKEEVVKHLANKFLIHRMQTPLRDTDYTANLPDHPDMVRALNCTDVLSCTHHDPQPPGAVSQCRQKCCTGTGISVFFLAKKTKQFYDSHFYLYKTALKECYAAAVHNGNPNLADDFAARHDLTNITSVNELNVALADLQSAHVPFPTCRICQSPPANTRIYVDKIQNPGNKHFHGVLQPLAATPKADYEQIAMGEGMGWGDCPFFVKAAGEIDDPVLEFPPPVDAITASMIKALDRLLSRYCWQFAQELQTPNVDPFEIAMYIIALYREPETLFDANADIVCACVDTHLAALLHESIKRGYVDPYTTQYDFIVNAIANGLDLEPSVVHVDDVAFRSPIECSQDVARQTTVLYGNIVPYHVVQGQRPQSEQSELDGMTDKLFTRTMTRDVFDIGPSRDDTNFDQRIQLFRRGQVIVHTNYCSDTTKRTQQALPLHSYVADRFCATTARRGGDVKLKEIGELLSRQSRASVRKFIHEATGAKNQAQIAAVLQSLKEEKSTDFEEESQVLMAASNVTVVSAAASVIAIISDDDEEEIDSQIHDILRPKLGRNDIADFVVVYLSCRLRLQMDAEGDTLPLASHSLMIISSTSDAVDDQLLNPGCYSIRPPMLHHSAFFTIIDLSRESFSHLHGVSLALVIKEGIQIARVAKDLHCSFIVWFVDEYPFDLSLAIQRERGSVAKQSDATGWAQKVVETGHEEFRRCGLKIHGTSVMARDSRIKRMMIVSWNEHLHKLAEETAMDILENSGVALGCEKNATFKILNLHTSDECRMDVLGD